jgi:hypothetical protein
MTTLPMFTDSFSDRDSTPVPLIVANKWDFPLAFHIVEGVHYYAIQDWIRGLTGNKDIRLILSQFKKHEKWHTTYMSHIRRMDYRASDGAVYKRDFAKAEGLYTIAQYLRVTRARPVLDEIRQFLSKAGVFVDEMRRDENLIVITSRMSPDEMLAATGRAALLTREAYRKQGKSERWIDMRLLGKVRREQFTAALKYAINEALKRSHFATATDDIYKGLWGRTASYLKKELALPKGASLRDNQTIYALHFQGIAEEACADKLGEKKTVSWLEARDIIQLVAATVGGYTQDMSRFLGKDLATGRPLLPQD